MDCRQVVFIHRGKSNPAGYGFFDRSAIYYPDCHADGTYSSEGRRRIRRGLGLQVKSSVSFYIFGFESAHWRERINSYAGISTPQSVFE